MDRCVQCIRVLYNVSDERMLCVARPQSCYTTNTVSYFSRDTCARSQVRNDGMAVPVLELETIKLDVGRKRVQNERTFFSRILTPPPSDRIVTRRTIVWNTCYMRAPQRARKRYQLITSRLNRGHGGDDFRAKLYGCLHL